MSLVFKQYGIELRRIKYEDIELIRYWRNHPNIRKYMGYQKKITKKQQKEWFQKIDNKFNYYFLIVMNETPFGVINTKDVNLTDRYAEGGIFIWEEKYINSPYPVMASLILLDFIFNEIEFAELSFVRVLESNIKAQNYNKQLGYVKLPNQESVENQWYVLSKEKYNRNSKKLRIGAKNYSGSDGRLIVKGDVSEKNIDELNNYLLKL